MNEDRDKVFVGVFYEMRKALEPRHRREAEAISLMNHVAAVYWSDVRRSYWYRSSTGEPCSIHEARISIELRASIAPKEPTRAPSGSPTRPPAEHRDRCRFKQEARHRRFPDATLGIALLLCACSSRAGAPATPIRSGFIC